MSLNKLVGGDCGGNNTLVQLSNIVSRDVAISQPMSRADSLVQEFMAQNYQTPETFNMNSLLNNIPKVENSQRKTTAPGNQPHVPTPWSVGPSTSYMPIQPMIQASYYRSQQPLMYRPNQANNVQIQYINESDIQQIDNADVRAKAQEYVDVVKDDELAYNQFMSFMNKISAGELNLSETAEGNKKRMSKEEILDEMAEKYKDEWEQLSNVTDYWNSEVANGIPTEYSFTESNVMVENKSALEIGKEKLKMGDIPGAVVCFEAAVQQQPDLAEPWFLLGTTQAENEQDISAITALKKSLTIDPRQLEAYITLAAAYANENMPVYAFMSLLEWLKTNSKYNDLVPQDIDTTKLNLKDLENHVKSLYLRAAQLNPLLIDPDVQNALGVVFNISQEYDKAVDCFKTALMVANDNSKLWNRLGATLANSDKSAEAVDAYHHALHLEPGFIRARYNVGITCMNLGAHRQAAEHFLIALNQQYKSKSMHPESSNTDTSSSSIWTTLRMVCSFMGEFEAAKLVDDRNLNELNNFFALE